MQFLDLACVAIVATLIANGTASAQTVPTAAAPAQTATTPTSTLSVTFTGIEAKRGAVMLALYDEAGWTGGRPIRAEMLDASTGSASVTLTGLPAGQYGVKAFHDINGNGKMDSNLFGMPTEPYAFSNDAKGQRGPAAWADASFVVEAGVKTKTITIR